MKIGQKIRQYRKQNALTLEELASRTELTKGFLSQLENDLTSPSIATLADITEALGISLEQFFASDREEQIVFSESDFFVDEQEDYTIHWIVPNAQKNEMEPIVIDLKPQGASFEVMPHGGQEFGYILKGRVTLQMEDKLLHLKKGETFYLKGEVVHKVVNNHSTQMAQVLWVSTPPIF